MLGLPRLDPGKDHVNEQARMHKHRALGLDNALIPQQEVG